MMATDYIGLLNSINGKNTGMSVNTEKDKVMELREYGLRFITHTLKDGMRTKLTVIISITDGIIIQTMSGHSTEMCYLHID